MRFERLQASTAPSVDAARLQRLVQHRLRRAAAASSPATSSPARPAGPAAAPTPSTPPRLSDGAHTVQVCAQDYGAVRRAQRHRRGKLRPAHDPHRQHAPGRALGPRSHQRQPGPLPAPLRRPLRAAAQPGQPDRQGPLRRRQRRGEVVEPEQTLSATNPTEVPQIEGPAKPGAYRLKLWLEDEVGFEGPAADSADPPRHDPARRAPGPLGHRAEHRRAAPKASTCAGATSPTPARRSTPPTTRCSTPPARSSSRPRPSPAKACRRSRTSKRRAPPAPTSCGSGSKTKRATSAPRSPRR